MDIKRIAKIGKGTKRKKRKINLLELSEEIKSIFAIHKSLKKVADIIKLSPEMVREFIKITELEKETKELIKKGLISSVDIGYRISKLSGNDQIIFSKYIIENNLSTNDVRAIIRYKLDNPKILIKKAIEKVIQSKDKKIYVAYLGIAEDTFKKLLVKNKRSNIRNIFYSIVHKENIVSFEINGRVVIIKVTMEGLLEMKNKAQILKIPLAKLADTLILEYLEGR